MTTVTLTNNGTYQAAEKLLWELDYEIGDDGKNQAGNPGAFVEKASFPGLVLTGVHQAFASGTPREGTTVDAFKSNQIKITTDGFSEDKETILAVIDIKGSNLDKLDATSVGSSLNLSYNSRAYLSADKSASSLAWTSTGAFAVDAQYRPATLTNDDKTDGAVTFTTISQVDKSTNLLNDDGTATDTKSNATSKMSGSFTAREDGNVYGTVKSLDNQSKETGSETYSPKLTLGSNGGVGFTSSGALSGEFDTLALTVSYANKARPDWTNSVSLQMKSAVSGFTAAVGNFAEGKATVGDVAAALFASADTITAKSGTCTLDGYGGNDVLVGGKGVDTFAFSTALGTGNVDTVKNFKKAGADKIALDDAIFTALGGSVTDNGFYAGTAAHDADDRIVYDGKTGALYYDADGNGAGLAVQFATIVGKVSLSAADFTVI